MAHGFLQAGVRGVRAASDGRRRRHDVRGQRVRDGRRRRQRRRISWGCCGVRRGPGRARHGDPLRRRRQSPARPAHCQPRCSTALDGFLLRLVSQAASRRNLTVVLPERRLAAAMRRLHEAVLVSREAERDASWPVVPSLHLLGPRSHGQPVESLRGRLRLRAGRLRRSRASAATPSEWPARRRCRRFLDGDAVPAEPAALASRGVNVVIGTTAGRRTKRRCRADPASGRIGVVAAPNFALGVNVFHGARREGGGAAGAARLSAPGFTRRITRPKRDAPSGTALALKAAFERAGYQRPMDMASTRAGRYPARTRSASTRRRKR